MTAAAPSAFVTAPAVPDPPAVVSTGWISRFSLLWFGFWMAQLVPVQLLLPSQLAAVDPDHYLRDFGVLSGVAGVVALVALPVFGALCDRTRSPFGRRRAWMAGGTVAYAVALACTGLVHGWGGVVAVWAVVTVGVSMATAGLTAVIADRVPDRQRGIVSGAVYGPQALGVVVGVGVITAVAKPPKLTGDAADDPTPLSLDVIRNSYVVLAVVLVVTAVWFVLRYREVEPEHEREPLTVRSIATGLWISPREHPDFAWAFGGRLLVNVANSFGTAFLLFFLVRELHRPDPLDDLLVLTLDYLFWTLVATAVSGVVSDRTGRRRVFVAGAAVLQGIGGLLLAINPSLSTGLVSAALLGAGYGAFMAVDQALVTEVLPDAVSRAKDLGIMNIGSVVPQSLGPLVGSLVIASLGGYPVLFVSIGVISGVGAVMVYRIRSVR